VGRPAAIEQVQMGQKLLGRRLLRQREGSRAPRQRDEPPHPLLVQIGQGRARTGRRIERPGPDQLAVFEVLHQGSVEIADQLGRRAEAAPHEGGARPADQRHHLRVPFGRGLALDEDEPRPALCGGPIEFALRGRDALGVLEPVLATEESEVDLRPVHLIEVDRIRAGIGGRQVLEEEHREEAAQERVALDERLHGAALFGELLLNTADEDGHRAHGTAALPAVHMPR
jgi:hypothetical protein